YGTEERYDGGGSMNIFRGASQTSIIAKANNTNNAGFSFSEMIGVFGTGVRAFGEQASISGTGIQMPSSGSFYMPMLNTGNQGNGITRSMQGGLNYRDTWSRHFDVNGSYFFTDQDNSQQSVRLRQAFSTDTAWRTAHRSAATSENRAHRVNMNMILLLDSSFSIIYNPSLSILSSGMRSADSLDFSRHVADTAEAFNETIAALHSTGAGTTITNNLVLRKRSRKRGRTLSVIATHMASDQERKYVTTTKSTLNPQDVSGESITESRNRLAGFSYTEPLGRVMIMEVNYSYGQSANVSRREIASFNRNTGRYDLRHDSLSGNFERQQEYHRGGINFRAAGKKHTIQAGVALQDITTEDRHLQTGSGAFMHNRDLFPSAIYQYQFRRTKSFKLVYRGSTRQPSITQLMEPVDMSSPPYYYTGNRSLVQEFSNTATISYNAFDPSSFRSLFLQVTASNTVDKISNDVTMHADGTQTLRPVNLPGFYAVGSNMNLGIPLNRLNTASFNFNTRLNILREPGVFNGQRTFTDCFMAGQELRLNLGGEGADVSLGGGITYTSVLYDHQQLKTPQSLLNGSYVTYTASGEADLALPAGFRLATDVDYTANRGRAEEYNVDYLMCNGSLIKVFGKKKGTELRLTAFDLLSQNVNVVRITGTNFIEDTRTNTLGRFYMLIFTMKLQKMGGK
ncbi:MAG TPA: outer membrane beta-barrel protein, partial [Flavisolibacter sp.]